jgi:hypothetical protein
MKKKIYIYIYIYIFYFNREGNFWHVVFQCDKKIIQFIGTILSLVFTKNT